MKCDNKKCSYRNDTGNCVMVENRNNGDIEAEYFVEENVCGLMNKDEDVKEFENKYPF